MRCLTRTGVLEDKKKAKDNTLGLLMNENQPKKQWPGEEIMFFFIFEIDQTRDETRLTPTETTLSPVGSSSATLAQCMTVRFNWQVPKHAITNDGLI